MLPSLCASSGQDPVAKTGSLPGGRQWGKWVGGGDCLSPRSPTSTSRAAREGREPQRRDTSKNQRRARRSSRDAPAAWGSKSLPPLPGTGKPDAGRPGKRGAGAAVRREGARIRLLGDWGGNTTSVHLWASPKTPPAWLHSCCGECVPKPTYPPSPAWSGAQTPALSAKPANDSLHSQI